ncbi:MAG: hypothetical protein AAF711_13815 [Planctomycetota bacterium]
MTIYRGIRALPWFTTLLLCAQALHAETWQDERYQLSMTSPDSWVAMSPALLAKTNAQVSHLTGRGFIAGFAFNETDTLTFPYMLVQFKPYASLPDEYRPEAKPDEYGKLKLVYALVKSFQQRPLTEAIDTPQFIDQYGSSHARLIRLEDDRFDFTGKIPHETGAEPIRYHTHGVIGKEGVGLVSVFTVENFSGLTYVIDNEMRTLAFASGVSMSAMPDKPPAPVPTPNETPAEQAEAETAGPAEPLRPTPVQPGPISAQEDAEIEAALSESENTTATTENPGNSAALVIILSLLGVGLLAAVFIAWYATHKKALARKARSRARRERLQASQNSAPSQSRPPRPTKPATARSRGSTGRRSSGTTRS